MSLPVTLSPSQPNVQKAVKSFLAAVLPGVSGQEPAVFQGMILGTTLTAAPLPGLSGGGIQGVIATNAPVLGGAPGTTIVAPLTGSGGAGTYQVSISQNIQIPVTMSTGVTIVAGQPNRVASPNNPWYVVMTAMFSQRLGTDQDIAADVKFTGAIAGGVLTVSSVATGAISPNSPVFSPSVAANTTILQQISGSPGGTGTYSVSPSQTVGSGIMSAGLKQMFMSAELTMQLDFHSPDTLSGDLAQTVSIAFRNEFATTFFSALAPPLNSISPLYADDPRQAPFINKEDAFEWRWVVDLHAQVDETISVAARYADSAALTLNEVP